MADAGTLGAGGGGGTMSTTVNVQTYAPRDMVRELQRGGAVTKALAGARRDFRGG